MCLSCGLTNYSAAIYHLFTHALFKALLFLTAGIVIHSVNHEQNLYKLGGLNKVLPLNTILLLLSSHSLLGIPFYSGFFSKDFILRCSFNSFVISELFIFWTSNFGVLLTMFYSTKLIYFLLRSPISASKTQILSVVVFK